jgi:hypothetical protein
MSECGSRFINSYDAMALAYRLVAEYDKHEKEQDAKQKETDTFVSSTPKKVWTRGGMIKKNG